MKAHCLASASTDSLVDDSILLDCGYKAIMRIAGCLVAICWLQLKGAAGADSGGRGNC